jgi:uncharacterized protein (TIGR04255 family)
MPDALAPKAYPKPPITEATLELRTDEAFDKRDLERIRDRFKRQYEKVEDLNQIILTVVESGKVSQTAKVVGFKMTAASAVDVLLLNSTAIGTSRLAPYTGFDELLAATKTNFELLTKVAGRRRITRIGARFVNRIDVPNELFQKTGRWSSFVRGARPSVPPEVAIEEGAYYMNLHTTYAGNKDIKLTLQTGVMNPVLIDHQSLQLDVDVAYESGIPQRVDELWDMFANLRLAKNAIFETCITDTARELFK